MHIYHLNFAASWLGIEVPDFILFTESREVTCSWQSQSCISWMSAEHTKLNLIITPDWRVFLIMLKRNFSLAAVIVMWDEGERERERERERAPTLPATPVPPVRRQTPDTTNTPAGKLSHQFTQNTVSHNTSSVINHLLSSSWLLTVVMRDRPDNTTQRCSR